MAQIRTIALIGGVSFERTEGLAELPEQLAEADNVVWVDVLDPGEAERSALMDVFGFHPLAMEDVATGDQRPKVDEYKGYLFTVTYGVVPVPPGSAVGEAGSQDHDFRTVEVHAFVGRNYLVTVHAEPLPALEEAQQRWTRGNSMLREGLGFLVYTVLDAIVDGYFPVVTGLEDAIERAEDAMVNGPTDVQVGELLHIRRGVLRLRRILSPMREAFGVLARRDRATFTPGTQVYLQDVHDHLLRMIDLVDAQRDLVTSALDASLTIVSNRLNETMKRLTTISASVGFAAAVFGAWGMNFVTIPAAETSYGFPLVVGGTVVMLLGGWAVVRRRGWL